MELISMDIKKTLENLSCKWGLSGFENDVCGYLCEKLNNLCSEVWTEKGNIIARINSFNPDKKTVLLEAHMDKIGLIVTEVCEGGFAKFKCLGGVDERTLPASEVYVLGSEPYFGVIGALPPHLKNKGDEEEALKPSDMFIDLGLDESGKIPQISVGDPIVLKSAFTPLANDIVSMAAIDNRGGVATILGCVESLKDKDLPYNVEIAFTTGEELGLQGAAALDTEGVDLAIVIDATHGRTPDAKCEETFALGCGPVICRGPNLDFDITNRVIDFARRENIPFEVEVAAGHTGTDAWAIQISGKGVPCVLVSIPVSYMHTVVETASSKDIESTAELISNLIRGGELFD